MVSLLSSPLTNHYARNQTLTRVEKTLPFSPEEMFAGYRPEIRDFLADNAERRIFNEEVLIKVSDPAIIKPLLQYYQVEDLGNQNIFEWVISPERVLTFRKEFDGTIVVWNRDSGEVIFQMGEVIEKPSWLNHSDQESGKLKIEGNPFYKEKIDYLFQHPLRTEEDDLLILSDEGELIVIPPKKNMFWRITPEASNRYETHMQLCDCATLINHIVYLGGRTDQRQLSLVGVRKESYGRSLLYADAVQEQRQITIVNYRENQSWQSLVPHKFNTSQQAPFTHILPVKCSKSLVLTVSKINALELWDLKSPYFKPQLEIVPDYRQTEVDSPTPPIENYDGGIEVWDPAYASPCDETLSCGRELTYRERQIEKLKLKSIIGYFPLVSQGSQLTLLAHVVSLVHEKLGKAQWISLNYGVKNGSQIQKLIELFENENPEADSAFLALPEVTQEAIKKRLALNFPRKSFNDLTPKEKGTLLRFYKFGGDSYNGIDLLNCSDEI